MTSDDVVKIVENMASIDVGLTTEEADRIVQARPANLPRPEPGAAQDDVEEIVGAAIAEVAEPEPRLTREEVRRISRNAVASVPPKSALADYTKFFVENAISRYDSEGLNATLAYYNRPESADGQWFAFIADGNGKIVGHYNPGMLGRGLDDLLGTDSFTASPDGGWVTDTDVNPETGKSESMNAWVVSHDGLVFGSGWYHGHVSGEN